MTVRFGWLQRLVCPRRHEPDHTDELITEAERTRRELLRLTERLTCHVAQLQAFARAYAGPQKGTSRG